MFVPIPAYGRGAGAFGPGVVPPFNAASGPVVIAPGFGPVMNPAMEREPVDVCKLFVGGLNPVTTDEELEEYMRQYGDVRSATIMFDRKNNRSRCFGFVTFSTEKETLRCFNSGPHTLGGNVIELRRAVPRTTMPPPQRGAIAPSGARVPPEEDGGEDPDERECKVFIGGIPSSMTPEDIRYFFTERFGNVKRVDFFYDKVTGRMRGFGFLVFSFPHSAKMAVGHHQIGDATIEVKKAMERHELKVGPPPRRHGPPRASNFRRPYPNTNQPVDFNQYGGVSGGPSVPRPYFEDPYATQPVYQQSSGVAYGGGYAPVDQQAQPYGVATQASASPSFMVPHGYNFPSSSGPPDVYGSALVEQGLIPAADPYEGQGGAMRSRGPKAALRSQPY